MLAVHANRFISTDLRATRKIRGVWRDRCHVYPQAVVVNQRSRRASNAAYEKDRDLFLPGAMGRSRCSRGRLGQENHLHFQCSGGNSRRRSARGFIRATTTASRSLMRKRERCNSPPGITNAFRQCPTPGPAKWRARRTPRLHRESRRSSRLT
jgi:hypothetical protein